METLTAPPGVPPALAQVRSTLLFLLLLIAVEGARSSVLAAGLLFFGLAVCEDHRRRRATVALWLGLSVVTFGKVLLDTDQWSGASSLSLQLAGIAGAFLIGSALKLALARCNIHWAAGALIIAGLAVSVIAPAHGFVFNRLLMIGALLIVAVEWRAPSVLGIAVALVVAGLQFMQGSRASALLVVAVTAWFVATSLFARGLAGRVVVVALTLLGSLIAISAAVLLEPLRSRVFLHGDVAQGLYLADRNKLATSAVRALSARPSTVFFGAEPGTFRHVDATGIVYPYPHNMVAQVLMDFGVVIGALLLVLVAALFVRSLQRLDQQEVATRCCALVALALVLLTMFNGTYLDYRFAALWLGAALAPSMTSTPRAFHMQTAALVR